MDGSQAGDRSLTSDRSRAGLDFAHRLLSDINTPEAGLDTVAAELAAAFAANAAGMADLQSGLPLVAYRADDDAVFPGVLPWENDPDRLSRIRQAPDALTIAGKTYAFLVVAVSPVNGFGWLLWIGQPSRTDWTAAEKSVLLLIAQLISRQLTDGGASRWGKQLERQVRQQHLEQAATLSRRLAHDFGNVLTGILGFSELALAQPQPAAAPLHRFINEIYRSARAGAHLTHQLQLFSRRQASSSRRGALPVALAEEEARFRSAAGTDVRWQLALPADLPALAFDQDHLRQVLGAVLDNAREAVADSGAVTVSARRILLSDAACLDHYGSLRPGPHVEVCVADTGAGLSVEAERRLFVEPFYTDKARRRGFGLAVAYGLLSAHRGGLSLANGPEGGAVARLLLPVADVPVSAVVPAVAPAPGSAAPHEKVLVVDDDPMILQFVSTTLEQAGYRVTAVTSADEALSSYVAAGSDPFCLVLSDVVMPRANGVDLARRLLTHNADARILFMSGQVSPDFARADFADRDFDLVSKPFRPEGLLRAVRGALDRDRPMSLPSQDEAAFSSRP